MFLQRTLGYMSRDPAQSIKAFELQKGSVGHSRTLRLTALYTVNVLNYKCVKSCHLKDTSGNFSY